MTISRGHPSTIHQVELEPQRSVGRRGLGRRWYQRRRWPSVGLTPCSPSGPARSWASRIGASPAGASGGRVGNMWGSPAGIGVALAERERVRLGAGLKEGGLQRSVADGGVLAYELVQAAVPKHAVAVLVNVDAVRAARSLAVEEHAKGDRLVSSGREHEMRVPGRGTARDAPAGLLERDTFRLECPCAREGPQVQRQPFGELVGAVMVEPRAIE